MLASVPTVLADSEHPPRLMDEADLLTDYEESDLLDLLNEISERQQFDVVVLTVSSLDGKTMQDYADDYFDRNGYGMGENRDGALLLYSTEENDCCISTSGYGEIAIAGLGIDYMLDERVIPYLIENDYHYAFETYARICDGYIYEANYGYPVDFIENIYDSVVYENGKFRYLSMSEMCGTCQEEELYSAHKESSNSNPIAWIFIAAIVIGIVSVSVVKLVERI